MTAKITIEHNSRTVLQVLEELTSRFEPKEMRPAMKQIGDALTESTKRRFESGTAPDGFPWKPLKEGTVLARIQRLLYDYDGNRRLGLKKGFSRKDGSLNKRGHVAVSDKLASTSPLVDSGKLKRTIRYLITDDGAGVVIGTNRFADEWDGGAAVHQFGSKDGRIPARPFLGLSNSDERMVLDILNGFIQESVSAK